MHVARAILSGPFFLLAVLLACAVAQADDEDARVALRLNDTGDGVEARADNRLAGPVEVLLSAPEGRRAPAAVPALPARAVLPAYDRRVLTRLQDMPATALLLRMVPGSPNAKPRDVEYGYPLGTRELRITQGWGGQHSHRDAENRHAVDFAVDEGTPVLAARAGTVMDIESGFSATGRSATDAGHANYVRILHDDGTMALYAHLQADGVRVRIGQPVRRGDAIGLSGNTGFSAGPHLHFVVQVNRGMSLESIPFRMFGPQGILRFSEAVSSSAQDSGDAASQSCGLRRAGFHHACRMPMVTRPGRSFVLRQRPPGDQQRHAHEGQHHHHGFQGKTAVRPVMPACTDQGRGRKAPQARAKPRQHADRQLPAEWPPACGQLAHDTVAKAVVGDRAFELTAQQRIDG